MGGKRGRMRALGQCEISSCVSWVCSLPTFPLGGWALFQVNYQKDAIPVHLTIYSRTIMGGRVGNFVWTDEFGNYACNFSFCFVNEFDREFKSMHGELHGTPCIQSSEVSENSFGLVENFHQSQRVSETSMKPDWCSRTIHFPCIWALILAILFHCPCSWAPILVMLFSRKWNVIWGASLNLNF